MTRYVVSVVLTAFTVYMLAADPPAKKEDPAEKVRKQFYRCWLETEKVEAGVRITDPEKLNGNEFEPSYSASWGRRGELSQGISKPGPRIDPTADPMRLDLRSEGYVDSYKGGRPAREDEQVVWVQPCVFKFDGENLVIAYSGKWVVEKEFKKGEDYAERPKDFTSTKENKRSVTTMKPSGKWETD